MSRRSSKRSTPTTGDEVALDTTLAIAVLNDSGGAGDWIRDFEHVHLPLPVVGELRFGALNLGRSAENLARIEALVSRCNVLEMTLSTAAPDRRARWTLL